jgi:hypothetical protein
MDAHRAISSEERVQLRQTARSAALSAALTGACVFVSLAVAVALVDLALRPAFPHQRPYLFAAAGLTAVLLAPLLCVLTLRRVQFARRLARDMSEGRVEGYLGTVEPDPEDDAQRRLVASGVLLRDPRRLQCVEVLPNSSTILRVNGRAAPRHLRAPTSELAATQPHRFATSLPPELVEVINDGGLDLQRRSLSNAEMEELDSHAARFRRRFRWTMGVAGGSAVALGSWFSHALGATIDLGEFPPALGEAVGWAAAALLLGLIAWMGYAVWLRITYRIEADKELSWVITVRDRDARAHPPKFEILPTSRLVWTEGRRPAGWRFDHD